MITFFTGSTKRTLALVVVAAAALIAGTAVPASAIPIRHPRTSHISHSHKVLGGATATSQIQALTEAYRTLYVADHDYHGHRIRAMHAIEKAVKLLGGNVHGDGKGHEKQIVSDDQLKQAEKSIEQVRATLAAHHAVTKHLDHAIKELKTALKIK
jgi:hypothetical protein